MRLAQRAPTCPACGRREPPAARWCGDCGARLPWQDRPAVLHVGVDRPDAAPGPPRRAAWRVWGGLVLVLALVAGMAWAADPSVAGDPDLLGRLDDATGRSSRLPPVDDLQLLWRRAVDAADAAPDDSVRLVDLGGRALVGDEVVDLSGATPPLALPAGAAPGPEGTLLAVDGTDVVAVDARTGRVLDRTPVDGGGAWRPHGVALGWVAGAAVFEDPEGRLGAVGRDGAVRWVGDPDWVWDGVGAGTAWLVVRDRAQAVERIVVVEGATGRVHRDVGPAGAVHAPVVHGDSLVWVDPHAGVDPGLGDAVEVHGLRLDGSGHIWTVTDLPPTSGVPEAVRLTAVEDSVAVAYWTAGQATTATWLAPDDGSSLGTVSVVGTGSTREGWPVTAVVGDALVHVGPMRQQIRAVDRHGRIRWAIPALPDEGVVAAGELVLVRTPPRGTSLQSRLRLLDTQTGRTRWDRVTSDTQAQQLVGVLGGHVGVGSGPLPAPLRAQAWLHLDTGRRRAGAGLAAEALGLPATAIDDASLLGRVALGTRVHPVLVRPDGRLVGPGAEDPTASLRTLLALPDGAALPGRASGAGGAVGADVATMADVADDRSGIQVGAASLVARDPGTGRQLWRAASPVALQHDLAVLLSESVVVVGVDGVARAWDRAQGRLRWTAPVDGATAITAGGEEVVLGTAGGEVVVLGDEGTVLQRTRVGRSAVEDVAVVDGRVVATVGGDVVGLGRGSTFIEPVDRVEVP